MSTIGDSSSCIVENRHAGDGVVDACEQPFAIDTTFEADSVDALLGVEIRASASQRDGVLGCILAGCVLIDIEAQRTRGASRADATFLRLRSLALPGLLAKASPW
jgi:hypothetical protein